jgi:excisionase family DNA binding protein
MFKGYPDILDVTQAGQALGVSVKTVYKLIQEGKLSAIKVGRAYRIPKISIARVFFVVEDAGVVFPVFDDKNN